MPDALIAGVNTKQRASALTKTDRLELGPGAKLSGETSGTEPNVKGQPE